MIFVIIFKRKKVKYLKDVGFKFNLLLIFGFLRFYCFGVRTRVYGGKGINVFGLGVVYSGFIVFSCRFFSF